MDLWPMRVSRAPEAVFQSFDGQSVLICTKTNEVFKLNRVGAWIWEHLEAERSVDELIDGITSTFGVDDKTAHADCVGFVDELARRGLLVRIES